MKQKWQIRLRHKLLLRRDSCWNALVRDFTAWLEKPYWPGPRWRRYPYGYPQMEVDFVIIGPECFAAADMTVISWRGENYYSEEGWSRLEEYRNAVYPCA